MSAKGISRQGRPSCSARQGDWIYLIYGPHRLPVGHLIKRCAYECCAALGRLKPSDGESAFPRGPKLRTPAIESKFRRNRVRPFYFRFTRASITTS